MESFTKILVWLINDIVDDLTLVLLIEVAVCKYLPA
jgi:hypothetical protein